MHHGDPITSLDLFVNLIEMQRIAFVVWKDGPIAIATLVIVLRTFSHCFEIWRVVTKERGALPHGKYACVLCCRRRFPEFGADVDVQLVDGETLDFGKCIEV